MLFFIGELGMKEMPSNTIKRANRYPKFEIIPVHQIQFKQGRDPGQHLLSGIKLDCAFKGDGMMLPNKAFK
jgi:hypothetical protein